MSKISAENQPNGRILGATWSNWPVEARLVEVVVAPTEWKWCKPFVDTLRKAIEVRLNGQTVYVDNEDGKALVVFMKGLAPLPGFRLLPVYTVYEDPSAKRAYQAQPPT